MPEVVVPNAASLLEGQTVRFSYQQSAPMSGKDTPASRRREGFVIRYEGRLLAFENSCPHWSVELDLGDGHFFDDAIRRIYCKNHGALFVLPSGECETGPCMGRALVQFPVQERGEDIVVST